MSRMTTTLRPRHEWKRIARTRLCALGCMVPSVLIGGKAAAQDCTISADDWSNIQLFRRCLAEVGLDWWVTPNGETILHSAASRTDNPTIVVLLLEAGADPNARNDWGGTPLHRGVYNSNPVVTAHLLAAGADPNIRDNDGQTPLHGAVSFGKRVLVSMLLDAGADPSAITYDDDGWTPLHLAAVGDDPTLVATLLNAGADPVARSADGRTPLHSAAYESGSRGVVSALLAGGAGGEFTTLHVAALTGDRAALTTALEEDGDPDAADAYGWTPLHFAALAGRWTDEPMMVEDLVAAGADLEARDLNGMTPPDVLSRYGGKASVAAALLRAGAGQGPDGGPAADSERGVISAEPASDVAGLEAGDMFRDCKECPEMVVVLAGSFMMGSPDTEDGRFDDEGPRHRVTIGTRIAVGVHEVTFAEWDACALAGGCADHWPGDEGWGRETHPVINMNWNDAQAYLAWLSAETREDYRLLTEAEWEYVARAGTTTAWYWGESESGQCRYGNGSDLFVDCADGYEFTAPVGSFQPNPFGLYDVLGNAWEWTEDCWNDDYSGAPVNGSAWESGDCSRRVMRGGGFRLSGPELLRSAIRVGETAGNRGDNNGFRVARTMK